VAVKETKNENDNWYFLTHDHLGSVHCILNDDGTLAQELSFDPYGNRRNPLTWRPFEDESEPDYIFDRGYTMHEHWDDFSLINMNGRVYDPVVARFLSPDPFVQDPGFSQNYNRYSYVMNNPLKYTDPSGNSIQSMFVLSVFLGEYTSNIINGSYNSLGSAWQTANEMTSNMSSAGQVPIYNKGNLTVSAGYDAFGVGVSLNASYNDSKGFAWGAAAGYSIVTQSFYGGANVSYQTGRYRFGIGVGYSKKNGWSAGAGITYDWGDGSFNYYYTYYGHSEALKGDYPGEEKTNQFSGGINFSLGDFNLAWENDFFAGLGEDGWRTNAIEIGIGNASIGTHVITNDPENIDDKGVWSDIDLNGKNLFGKTNTSGNGAWVLGQVLLSPAYVSYRNGNRVSRIGFSSKWIQQVTQNNLHRNGPGFSRTNYFNKYEYFYTGGWGSVSFNPFSLY